MYDPYLTASSTARTSQETADSFTPTAQPTKRVRSVYSLDYDHSFNNSVKSRDVVAEAVSEKSTTKAKSHHMSHHDDETHFFSELFLGAFYKLLFKQYNKKLLSHLKLDIEQGNNLTICNGSARQSANLDCQGDVGGWDQFGSCYACWDNLEKYLQYLQRSVKDKHIDPKLKDNILGAQIKFDPVSIYDILIPSKKVGDTRDESREHFKFHYAVDFKKTDFAACRELFEKEILEPELHDRKKIALIYFQMQKVASEHPDEQIIFNFCDDNKDILFNVRDFYERNPDLIPWNMTLQLFRHVAGNSENSETMSEPVIIDGCGMIDTDYDKSIRWIFNRQTELDAKDIIEFITDRDELESFRKQRTAIVVPVISRGDSDSERNTPTPAVVCAAAELPLAAVCFSAPPMGIEDRIAETLGFRSLSTSAIEKAEQPKPEVDSLVRPQAIHASEETLLGISRPSSPELIASDPFATVAGCSFKPVQP